MRVLIGAMVLVSLTYFGGLVVMAKSYKPCQVNTFDMETDGRISNFRCIKHAD